MLLKADTTLHRVAVNVRSASPNSASNLLFQTTTSLPSEWRAKLQKLSEGYRALPSKAGGLALDYVRGGLVNVKKMVPVPPDAPGVDNDLKDKLEDAVVKAI
ncbi:MAG: DUF2278 family protein [Planctomyces sp.]